ncbi:MAG TPA: hypothetical protein VNO21_02955, partial [Polyangiaceae bacterium]|nr:hypothetical protein [Polyangiaceae bacterium]
MTGLRIVTLAATSAFVSMIAAAGCGSSSDSGFGNGTNDGTGTGNGTGGNGGGGGTFGGGSGDGGSTTSGGSVGNVTDCQKTTAQGALIRVNLIAVFDKSGSMGDDPSQGVYNLTTRWNPVTAGMKTFFNDPQSAEMSASLTYFPNSDNSCGSENESGYTT